MIVIQPAIIAILAAISLVEYVLVSLEMVAATTDTDAPTQLSKWCIWFVRSLLTV